MVAMGSMIALWFFIRVEKYVAFEENVTAIRYLWYAYYIPTLMIPQLSFSTSITVNSTEKKRSLISFITGTISSILLCLVLTNDLHQLVFKFNNGFENVDDYSHKLLYYIVFAWSFIMMIASLVVLLHKCAITANKKLGFIIAVYIIIFITYSVLILIDKRFILFGEPLGEFPETVSFLMGGVLVLCISAGFIPSNISYSKLISKIEFATQITDADYKVVYRSPSAVDMTIQQMSKDEAQLDESTKVFRKKVSGGYAFWQVDISELNDINDKLEDVKETLSEETEIIRLDNELKEKQAKIDEKSKVYDEIAIKVYNQSAMIEKLSNQAKENPEMFEQNMAMVCVFAMYIKRMANLMLLASENETINKVELLLAINESARYIRKMNVVADVIADFENDYIPSNEAISLYEKFQYLLEKANKNLSAFSVIICDDKIKISLEGVSLDLPDYSIEVEDDTTFVSLPIRKVGDTV